MKLPELAVKWPEFPKRVNISLAVIGGSILFLVIFLFTLGSARDEAASDVIRIKQDVERTQKALKQSKEDYEYILANREHFDALLQSDKLIPHTRRTAIRQMQALALEFGLSTLNYSFQAAGTQSPQAVSSQPQAGSYKVSVEGIDLTLGSPLDSNLFSFVTALHDDFPGTVVLNSLMVQRDFSVSAGALNEVSRGRESGLVKATAKYLWKTAQQNKEDDKKGDKGGQGK